MKDYKDYDESDAEMCISTFHYVMVAIFVIVVLALFTGCAHTKYVTIIEHHTDSVYIAKHTRDSIYMHDSTFVEVKGDTTLIERWHTAWRERVVHDTSVVVRVDSVPMPYPVEKKVEKQLSWWQRTQMYAGDVLFVLLSGVIVYVVIWIRHRLL